MLGRMIAAAAFLLAATPALADSSRCVEPIPPASINGNTATEQQMKDAIADFKTFQQASDDYQSCLLADLKAQQLAAAKAKDPKPLDPSVAAGVDARIDANQKLKERLGAELNAAIIAYKSKHPGQ